MYFKGDEEDKYLGFDFKMTRESNDDEVYIDSVAVNENFRGLGIAERLINRVYAEAKILGYPKVSLLVDQNDQKLQNYYKKLGFTEKGQLNVNYEIFFKMVHLLKEY